MSQSEPSKVFMFDGDDPEMAIASQRARDTFGHFWREIAWERRRIVPALDLACVKAPFSDEDDAPAADGAPRVEQMWINDVDFDGKYVSGELLNSPNWLASVKQGDAIRLPLAQISDWMYGIDGEVYGAFTVNLLRSRMGTAERREHDDAWGLNFGDPLNVRVVEETKSAGGFLSRIFGKKPEARLPIGEHLMSVDAAPSLKQQIAKDPSFLISKDDRGWTMLHHEALAGSLPTVRVLLEAGAYANALTNDGRTPAQLARSLNWSEVATLLERK